MTDYSFGYTFSKDTREITGTQDRLRYSAWNLWIKNKDQYRKRYYKGESFHNVEMLFGSEIHKILEDDEEVKKHPILATVPRFDTSEHNIECTIGGVKVGGCLDSFDSKTHGFLDYKNSHLGRNGQAPWDKVKVKKHEQLPFYSTLIEYSHGWVFPYCQLVWLETAFQTETHEFDGHTLSAQTRKLELTGRVEVFKRRIAQWERDRIVKSIREVAAEIDADFKHYQTLT